MSSKKNHHGPKKKKNTSGKIAKIKTPSNASKVLTLTSMASELLEFRLFAIENGYTYLSRIIEPVVNDILYIAYQLDQRYKKSEPSKRLELHDAAEGLIDNLTSSELECLKWCSLGNSNEKTAVELGIHERTVSYQLKLAKQKLNATTNAHAVAILIRLKII
ncbi:hypothetical protein MNBD_ALPHA08-2517 [hydrothermal vent metagenome]|uniref:HTH luxR-type domain-containing protein n=1 Tax=hydrothermal vent metagenome TaxID=652676 RepID=A0A3B0S9W2_9ZZZZ